MELKEMQELFAETANIHTPEGMAAYRAFAAAVDEINRKQPAYCYYNPYLDAIFRDYAIQLRSQPPRPEGRGLNPMD